MASNILPAHEIKALLDSLELPSAGARRAAGMYLLQEIRKLTQHRPTPALPANVIRLVPRTAPKGAANTATIECLTQLLELARAGECTGLAFVAVGSDRRHIVDSVGEADRSTTWTRGALRALDDKLAARIQERAHVERP